MAITVNDFPALTDDLQEIFNEGAKRNVAEMVGNKVFEVRDTNRRTFDHLILHGVNGIQEVTPGADLPTVNTDEGDSITYTQRYFGGNFKVTKEMRKFDLYSQIEGLARTLTDSAFDNIDQSYADVLLNGWSTSYNDVWNGTVTSTGPDGLALFSTDHTNGVSTSSATFRNRIKNSSATEDPALDRDAIVTARRDAKVHKDPEGHKKPVRLDRLIVAPSNEDLAERTILSTQMSGTANNDVNPLKGKIKEILVWERLEENSAGTDTSAYWFMQDMRAGGESLKSKFAERPSLDAPEQVYRNKNWEYTIDFFYTVGLGYPAYIWGSRGTA